LKRSIDPEIEAQVERNFEIRRLRKMMTDGVHKLIYRFGTSSLSATDMAEVLDGAAQELRAAVEATKRNGGER
jgi:hypothetical protein